MQQSKLTSELFEILNSSKRSMNARFHVLAESLGISRSQLEVILTIYELQPIASTDLAKKLVLTPGAISQLVEGLVQLQWVTRQPCPDDRRTQLLSLTPRATKHVESMKKWRFDLIKQVTDELTDEELQTYMHVQKKIMTAFETTPTNNIMKDHS